MLDGFSILERADGGRGQPLLPWPNRILDGQYEFDGLTHQLPVDEVERSNAIHGLTRWQSWSVVEHGPSCARLALTVYPRPGYPFVLRLEIEYSLEASGLRVQTRAYNAGDRPLPFGAGQHPYLCVGTPRVDTASLQFAAGSRLEMDPHRLMPTGERHATAGTSLDFHAGQPIGETILVSRPGKAC